MKVTSCYLFKEMMKRAISCQPKDRSFQSLSKQKPISDETKGLQANEPLIPQQQKNQEQTSLDYNLQDILYNLSPKKEQAISIDQINYPSQYLNCMKNINSLGARMNLEQKLFEFKALSPNLLIKDVIFEEEENDQQQVEEFSPKKNEEQYRKQTTQSDSSQSQDRQCIPQDPKSESFAERSMFQLKDLYSDSELLPSEKLNEQKLVFQNNVKLQEKRESFDGQTNNTSIFVTDNNSCNQEVSIDIDKTQQQESQKIEKFSEYQQQNQEFNLSMQVLQTPQKKSGIEQKSINHLSLASYEFHPTQFSSPSGFSQICSYDQQITCEDQCNYNSILVKPKKNFKKQDDIQNYIQGFRVKYKTEMCRNWELTGYCEFMDSCSFAHGDYELQSKAHVPQNYKTRLCKRFHENLYCPYGIRCQFLHSEKKQKTKPYIDYMSILQEDLKIVQAKLLFPSSLQQKDISCNSNENINILSDQLEKIKLSGKRKRLPVFSSITFGNENKKNGKAKKVKKSKKQSMLLQIGSSQIPKQQMIGNTQCQYQQNENINSIGINQQLQLIEKKAKKKKVVLNSYANDFTMCQNSIETNISLDQCSQRSITDFQEQ